MGLERFLAHPYDASLDKTYVEDWTDAYTLRVYEGQRRAFARVVQCGRHAALADTVPMFDDLLCVMTRFLYKSVGGVEADAALAVQQRTACLIRLTALLQVWLRRKAWEGTEDASCRHQ